MLTTQLALVMQSRLFQLGLWEAAGEYLIVGETLQQHHNFSPSVDANSQVLLQRGFRLYPVAAHLALSSSIGSEKRADNW
jgi:hypothetical protein